MRYNITIVIDKNILPQLLNKKKEVRTMGKKKHKKSDKNSLSEKLVLITAIVQLVTAIIIMIQQLLS